MSHWQGKSKHKLCAVFSIPERFCAKLILNAFGSRRTESLDADAIVTCLPNILICRVAGVAGAPRKSTPSGLASEGQMRKPPSHRFAVTVTQLPVTRCQICHRTVAYRPGNLTEVLTKHYLRTHPEALELASVAAHGDPGTAPQLSEPTLARPRTTLLRGEFADRET